MGIFKSYATFSRPASVILLDCGASGIRSPSSTFVRGIFRQDSSSSSVSSSTTSDYSSKNSSVLTHPDLSQIGHAASATFSPYSIEDNETLAEIRENDLSFMFDEIHKQIGEAIFSTNSNTQIFNLQQLQDMSVYYFDGKGKHIRPLVTMTYAHAINHELACRFGVEKEQKFPKKLERSNRSGRDYPRLLMNQRYVALVSEMIHTSSLVHDDILDNAHTRRGKVSINRLNHSSTLQTTQAGNLMMAVASKCLAQIGSADVLKIASHILSDLVEGEFQQMEKSSNNDARSKLYLTKSYNKTATLFANTCKCVASLSLDHHIRGASTYNRSGSLDQHSTSLLKNSVLDGSMSFGKHLGMAFQIVDDALDFVQTSEDVIGKATGGADLKLGLATAPVLFAAQSFPRELEPLIERRFTEAGDVERTIRLVAQSDAIDKTKALAFEYADRCKNDLRQTLPSTSESSPYVEALNHISQFVLSRNC